MGCNIKTLASVTVATAGTRVQASASKITGVVAIVFQADAANTNNAYVGDVAVASSRGQSMKPGESWSVTATEIAGRTEYLDITQFYCDADTNGNKVRVSYLTHS